MPLQGSGQIKISQINSELGLSNSNSSLASLSGAANNTDPCNLSNLPGSNSAPHAMSEFYAYDHNCTSGPTLTPCEVVGPFGSPDEACGIGPMECEAGNGITVFTTNQSTCCPQDGDFYYQDFGGTLEMEPGVYYACQCLLGPTWFFYDGEGGNGVAGSGGCR
jgi:hypothetical protein